MILNALMTMTSTRFYNFFMHIIHELFLNNTFSSVFDVGASTLSGSEGFVSCVGGPCRSTGDSPPRSSVVYAIGSKLPLAVFPYWSTTISPSPTSVHVWTYSEVVIECNIYLMLEKSAWLQDALCCT